LGKVFQMSNIEHFSRFGTLHHVAVKTRELTRKQILSVPCPTCRAVIGKACALLTGALRSKPHRDRKLSAAEAVERSQSKRPQKRNFAGKPTQTVMLSHDSPERARFKA